MARIIDLGRGIGRRELKAVRGRFEELNRIRLGRALDEMRGPQQAFVRALPLLFHFNHPMLPGFRGQQVPAGIRGYHPDDKTLKGLQQWGRGIEPHPRQGRDATILALYLMGSLGSIGHSRASDLDVWLCHRPELDPAQREALARKAEAVEEYAAGIGLEVHFFLMDADAFRKGESLSLSDESSGSTQHGLLLEEFYRSSLLLAGLPPLWWLVPVEQEAHYRRFTRELIAHRHIDPADWLDFGGLDQIPAGEFFGAALWQLYKGIHSPHKSVLKILLMEAYAREYPHPRWLSLEIKKALYRGEGSADDLDPYLLMYRRVESQIQDRHERLELVRRCLYFKVGKALSQPRTIRDWRAQRMSQLVEEWGWDLPTLRRLDERPYWRIHQVIPERTRLVAELTRSYRVLTDFAHTRGDDQGIAPRDLTLIGRKLYTALEQRPGKIERVNPGISMDLAEDLLEIQRTPGGWRVRRPTAEGVSSPSIKITKGLSELLAWCHLNGLCTERTRFRFGPGEIPVTARELQSMRKVLGDCLPAHLDAPLEHLATAPSPTRIIAFANVGADPFARFTHDGIRLVTDRADPLSFGAARRCLVHNLEILVATTWGELLAQRHEGPEGLLDGLCFVLDLSRPLPSGNVVPMRVEGLATADGSLLARRIGKVLEETQTFFSNHPEGRYLITLGQTHYLIEPTPRGFHWTAHDDLQALLHSLAAPRPRFGPLGFDPHCLQDTALPAIYARACGGGQQVFYQALGQGLRLYVVDEGGALFSQDFDEPNPGFVLIQQYRFLESLARLRRLAGAVEEAETLITGPQCYQLLRGQGGAWETRPVRLPYQDPASDFMELRLVAEQTAQDTQVLALISGDREFSTLDLGQNIYTAVARHVLAHRHGGGDYPIYLTAVELSQERYGAPPAGVELLQLKAAVERRLNQALRLTLVRVSA